MFTTKQTLILVLLFLPFTFLSGQKIEKLLMEKKWSAYDNFAMIDFQEGGKAIFEYAYCTYCKDNRDTLDWSVKKDMIIIGSDTLVVKSQSSRAITTYQYQQKFTLTAIDRLEPSALNKDEITDFLTSNDTMFIKVKSVHFDNSKLKAIHFEKKGQMWIGESEFRGQWALKYFYGNIFLIYINRYALNKDFPLLKILEFNNKKLSALPIPSLKRGSPFVVEIILNDEAPLADGGE